MIRSFCRDEMAARVATFRHRDTSLRNELSDARRRISAIEVQLDDVDLESDAETVVDVSSSGDQQPSG